MATRTQRESVKNFNRLGPRRKRFAKWTHRHPVLYGLASGSVGAAASYAGGRAGNLIDKLPVEASRSLSRRGAVLGGLVVGGVGYGAARYMRNARRAVAKGKSRKR